MSDVEQGPALAAILDALTMIQEQLEEMAARSIRLEAKYADMVGRLDTIDAALAGATNAKPMLDEVLQEVSGARASMRDGLSRVAEVAAWAHAAAMGNRAALPTDILDDPLLERFAIDQPADRMPDTRALVDWRRASSAMETPARTEILAAQYAPSPTDDPHSRVLRYQLAAITREELLRRGATPSAAPATTRASDRSATAQRARSAELLRTWRAGEGGALYAEPELSGALDIVAAAKREGASLSEAELFGGLAALHRTIERRLEAGERPALATDQRRLNGAVEIKRDR